MSRIQLRSDPPISLATDSIMPPSENLNSIPSYDGPDSDTRRVTNWDAGAKTSEPQDAGRGAVRNAYRGMLKSLPAWLALCLFSISFATAQEPFDEAARRDIRATYVPLTELNEALKKGEQGVFLSRDKFRELFNRATAAGQAAPEQIADWLVRDATYVASESESQAVVEFTAKLHQAGTEPVFIPIALGHLKAELVELNGVAALCTAAADDPQRLIIRSPVTGASELRIRASAPIRKSGPQRKTTFPLFLPAPSVLRLTAVPGESITLNQNRLLNLAEDQPPTEIDIPVGGESSVVEIVRAPGQAEQDGESLVFVTSNVQLEAEPASLLWESRSQVRVYGTDLDALTVRVPSSLEITAVDSVGLDSWKLEDDPDDSTKTLVRLKWRRPFRDDRLINISGVSRSDQVGALQSTVPQFEFAGVTTQSGRITIRHRDDLRLRLTTGSGVRPIPTIVNQSLSAFVRVVDFWRPDYDIAFAVEDRQQELFAILKHQLGLRDSAGTLVVDGQLEALNLPLFEFAAEIPEGWQVLQAASNGSEIPWTNDAQSGRITLRPTAAIEAGSVYSFRLILSASLPSVDTTPLITAPLVRLPQATPVSGQYHVTTAGDIQLSPESMTGLTPLGSSTANGLSFLVETASPELTLRAARRVARLSARTEIRHHADERTQTAGITTIVDMTEGTRRELTILLSEELGDDLRFRVISINQVPGAAEQDIPENVVIREQLPDDLTEDGLRPWRLIFDDRITGSLMLQTDVTVDRLDPDGLSAARVVVRDAVRQHGLLVFEAGPEQRLTGSVAEEETAATNTVAGITPADPGLVDAPDESSDRRVALVYRFTRPDYNVDISTERYDIVAVPTAVCTQIVHAAVVAPGQKTRRTTTASVVSSGVQTLRFQLPEGTDAELWSTMLNGRPVPVRRDEADYLVSIPTEGADPGAGREDALELVFETDEQQANLLDDLALSPVRLFIDQAEEAAAPIDILRQEWAVSYPNDVMLVNSLGPATPDGALDQPGWLRSLQTTVRIPEWRELNGRLFLVGMCLLVALILTGLVCRRRWKTLAGLVLLSIPAVIIIGGFLALGSRARTSWDTAAQVMPDDADFAMETEGAAFLNEPSTAPAETNGLGVQLPDSTRFDSGFGASSGEARDMAANQPMQSLDEDFDGAGSESPSRDANSVIVQSDGLTAGQARDNVLFIQEAMPGGGGLGGGGAGGMGGLGGGMGGQTRGLSPGPAGQNSVNFIAPNTVGGLARPQSGTAVVNNGLLGFSQLGELPNDAPAIVEFEALSEGRSSGLLSIPVAVTRPAGYNTRVFRGIANVVRQAEPLRLTLRNAHQSALIRLLAFAATALLLWLMRNRPVAQKCFVLFAAALIVGGLVAVVAPGWQPLLDGAAAGILTGVILWFTSALFTAIRRTCDLTRRGFSSVKARFSPKTTAVIIMALGGSLGSLVADDQNDTGPLQILVPYEDPANALESQRIFIRQADFVRLQKLAYPDESFSDEEPGVSLLGSWSHAEVQQTPETAAVLKVTTRYLIQVTGPADIVPSQQIRLPLRPVTLTNARLNDQPTTLQVLGTTQGREQQQQQLLQKETAPTMEAAQYAVKLRQRGLHVLDVDYLVPIRSEGPAGDVRLPVLTSLIGEFRFRPPAENLTVEVNGQKNILRTAGEDLMMPAAAAGGALLAWQPATQAGTTDRVLHVTADIQAGINDEGLIVTYFAEPVVRQGELAELTFLIPQDYTVQSVECAAASGWTTSPTVDADGRRQLTVPFRTPLSSNSVGESTTDSARLEIRLFRSLTLTDEAAAISLPIPEIPAATRHTGQTAFYSSNLFQVRTESISGVTQVDPGRLAEAQQQTPESMPAKIPALAWRYRRTPAEIIVRVARAADERAGQALHAVRVTEQYQDWASRLQVRTTSRALGRIEIEVPAGMLITQVESYNLADWYVLPTEEGSDAARLIVQYPNTRTGTFVVGLTGRMDRSGSAEQLQCRAPRLIGTTKQNHWMAVWLPQSRRLQSLETANWQSRRPNQQPAELRQLNPSTPDILLQTGADTPEPVRAQLQQAVATLMAEALTVTNVTETATEFSLGLNWTIRRAAADAFSVVLPASYAEDMHFDVPNLRSIRRDPLDNDEVRITFSLQQPVSDSLFVLGTGVQPLPANGRLLPVPVRFEVDQDQQATVETQSAWWMLVNQSSGLLTPPADDGPDVDADRLGNIRIPETLRNQAIAVRRVTSDFAPWELSFPAQFEVAPAVVTLATHHTVIADDGSWRSLHELHVQNESRQYLPFIAPENARVLACLVADRPVRTVVRQQDGQPMYLIPMPPAGSFGTSLTVRFLLTGMLAEAAEQPGRNFGAERIEVPVPIFPEYSENPEYGITISRNSWSVYLPDSWQSVTEDDPRLSNVTEADDDALTEMSVLSEIEDAILIGGSVLTLGKSSGGFEGKLMESLDQKRSLLNSLTVEDAEIEEQRQQALQQINDAYSGLQQQFGDQDADSPFGVAQPRGQVLGNGYLYYQDLSSNTLNFSNNDGLARFNRRFESKDQSPATGGETSTTQWFFDLSDSDRRIEEEQREFTEEYSLGSRLEMFERLKSDDFGRQMDRRSGRADDKSGEAAAKKSQPQSQTRGRRLMEQSRESLGRGGRTDRYLFDAESAPEESIQLDANLDFGIPDVSLAVPEVQDWNRSATQGVLPALLPPSVSAERDTPAAAGFLSLNFEIPRSGNRLDYVRTAGNPKLTLRVRSADKVRAGYSWGWLIGCLAFVAAGWVLMQRAGFIGFAVIMTLAGTVLGITGWILLEGPGNNLAFALFVVSLSLLSLTLMVRSFRRAATLIKPTA